MEKSGYEDEPREHFDPLPTYLYTEFYDLERRSGGDDCSFYAQELKHHGCKTVLELGCGTGYVLEFLFSRGYEIIGVDCDHHMLAYKRDTRKATVCEMDMRQLGFNRKFDGVIVPRNTLCLLSSEEIGACLKNIRALLSDTGVLIAQLYTPTTELRKQAGKRLFQFSIHDTPQGRKLIKETIRTYHPERDLLQLEERFKVRSFDHPEDNNNYRHTLALSCHSAATWRTLFQAAGFTLGSHYSSDTRSGYNEHDDANLFITLHK